MNALLSRVLETFTSLQGKRNTVKSTRITVTAVEHERHDLHTSNRLTNRRWSSNMAHDEITVTLSSKFGDTQLVFTAYDYEGDAITVQFSHKSQSVSFFDAALTEDDVTSLQGFFAEHVELLA